MNSYKAQGSHCSLLMLRLAVDSFMLLGEQRHVFCFSDGGLDTWVHFDLPSKMEPNTFYPYVCFPPGVPDLLTGPHSQLFWDLTAHEL